MKGLFQRLRNSLRLYGVGGTGIKLGSWLAEYWFDMRYQVETLRAVELDDLTIESENKVSGFSYQPTRVLPLRKLFQLILPLIPAESVLVDFGCGKGRVLIVASEFGFKEVRGVEFSQELCEIARSNCAIYKARTGVHTEFRIIQADVADYAVNADEMVIFLFNPFNERVMASALINICASLELCPRKMLLIYHNPEYDQVFEVCDDFVKLYDLNYWGYKFTVYSSVG